MKHDWAARLHEVIEDHRHRRFSWTTDYCGLFAARCHDAMTGSEFESAVSAQCSEEGAIRYLARHGGLQAAVYSFLGQPTHERAVRGDVVLIDGGEGEAVGICLGSKVVALGPDGLRYLPRSEIKTVWSVR